MEMVWRWYGDGLKSDHFYTDFMAKLVWKLSEVLWRKHGKSNYQKGQYEDGIEMVLR